MNINQLLNMKKKISDFLGFLNIKAAIKLALMNNALRDIGWIQSYNSSSSIDYNNKILPWCTYSYIYFIRERLNENLSIFEYGSGSSTIFYSNFVKSIVSVEHDSQWFQKIKNLVPKNVDILLVPIGLDFGESYAKSIYSKDEKYDIIIVDGRYRVKCVIEAAAYLTDIGVIILDNSERSKYEEAKVYVKNIGFKQIDFWGMSPGVSTWNCTSIFYRDFNCLSI